MKRHLLGFLCFVAIGMFTLSSCQKAPELTISSPASIELSADGSNGTITFTANRDWTASSSDSWVTVSPTSGEASDKPVTVSVRCNANTTYDDRTATVTIRMEDLSQTVTVRQPANLGVVLPKQTFDLQSGANSIDVEVQANVQYAVSTSVDWIKQTGTKGLTSNTLTFSIEENKTYDAREGKITIKPQNSSVQEQVISVKQAQKDALNVEKTSYEMPYGGGEIEIKVESNVSFDVTPNVDWIHFIQTKALSNSTVSLKIDENATFSSRQGTVEIKQKNGTLKHTITVNQAGMIAVSSVKLDISALALELGESRRLYATVMPDNATNKTVTWTSSNSEIATVDNAGKVTAVNVGYATITAKAEEKTADCLVRVCIPIASIELNKTELKLIPGETATLVATVKPDNATDKVVTWSSSNTAVATIDNNGKVTAKTEGDTVIMVMADDGMSGVFALCAVSVKGPNTPDGAIDLGIIMTREDGSEYSLFWAKCNIGASKPEEYGDYYAWGETEPKSYYSWSNYKWGANDEKLTKYCPFGKLQYWGGTGMPDDKLKLDPEDDVAHVKLGGKWRLPTEAEWTALRKNCKLTMITQNGVYGCKLTSMKNGSSIFLPAAGEILSSTPYNPGISGIYWSSTFITRYARTIDFPYDNNREFRFWSYLRSEGHSVRPVSE